MSVSLKIFKIKTLAETAKPPAKPPARQCDSLPVRFIGRPGTISHMFRNFAPICFIAFAVLLIASGCGESAPRPSQDGTFELPEVSTASAPGSPNYGEDPVTLPVLRLRVIDRLTGTPIRAFEDRWITPGSPSRDWLRHDDPDGVLTSPVGLPATCQVHVRAPGYAETIVPISSIYYPAPLEGPIDLFTLALDRGIAPHGVVRSAVTGEALEGASLMTADGGTLEGDGVWLTPRIRGQSATSDSEGRFELQGLTTAQIEYLLVMHPDFPPAFVPLAAAALDGTLEIMLPAAGSIRATLTENGAPATRFLFYLRREFGAVQPGYNMGYAVDSHEFSRANLAPGPYVLEIYDKSADRTWAKLPVIVHEGIETRIAWDTDDFGTITGRLPDALPRDDVIVELAPADMPDQPFANTTPDAQGAFTFAHVPPGAYTLHLRDTGLIPRTRSFPCNVAQGETVALRLEQTQSTTE